MQGHESKELGRGGGASAGQHLINLDDTLGSTAIVIDRETGELVESTAYLANGATESDYRADRWKGLREDYRFTGKEEDVEVGLQYFGKRFLSPYIGRWVSADPLAVHVVGKADWNLYAYVHGTLLRSVDPLGLLEDKVTGSNIEVDFLDWTAGSKGPRIGDTVQYNPITNKPVAVNDVSLATTRQTKSIDLDSTKPGGPFYEEMTDPLKKGSNKSTLVRTDPDLTLENADATVRNVERQFATPAVPESRPGFFDGRAYHELGYGAAAMLGQDGIRTDVTSRHYQDNSQEIGTISISAQKGLAVEASFSGGATVGIDRGVEQSPSVRVKCIGVEISFQTDATGYVSSVGGSVGPGKGIGYSVDEPISSSQHEEQPAQSDSR